MPGASYDRPRTPRSRRRLHFADSSIAGADNRARSEVSATAVKNKTAVLASYKQITHNIYLPVDTYLVMLNSRGTHYIGNYLSPKHVEFG